MNLTALPVFTDVFRIRVPHDGAARVAQRLALTAILVMPVTPGSLRPRKSGAIR